MLQMCWGVKCCHGGCAVTYCKGGSGVECYNASWWGFKCYNWVVVLIVAWEVGVLSVGKKGLRC